MDDQNKRYTRFAVLLHWVMAVCFLLMIGGGLYMSYGSPPKALQFNLYQWHKSLGVLLLVAFFVRVVWRLTHTPPALPEHMPRLERIGAVLGHLALYAFMLAVPLAGWAMVSASIYGLPTIVFGLFEWPRLPGVAGNQTVYDFAATAHWVLAWSFGAMILLHMAAVIKHAVIDKENLLARIWWK